MWLITPIGMFSAVQSPHQPHELSVRSRVRADAQHLSDWCRANKPADDRRHYPIKVSRAGQDYPFRVFLPKTLFAEFTYQQAATIDYPNFKTEVGHRQGMRRADTYHDVWADLATLEWADPEPRPGGPGWAAGRRPFDSPRFDAPRFGEHPLTGPVNDRLDDWFRVQDADVIDGPARCIGCGLAALDPQTVDESGDRCRTSWSGEHRWTPADIL